MLNLDSQMPCKNEKFTKKRATSENNQRIYYKTHRNFRFTGNSFPLIQESRKLQDNSTTYLENRRSFSVREPRRLGPLRAAHSGHRKPGHPSIPEITKLI